VHKEVTWLPVPDSYGMISRCGRNLGAIRTRTDGTNPIACLESERILSKARYQQRWEMGEYALVGNQVLILSPCT